MTDKKRGPEPKSELARYVFGYTDKKPSKSYWAILALMCFFVISKLVTLGPQ